LLNSGRITDAVRVFQSILEQLGSESSPRKASILSALGRCYMGRGLADQSESYQRQALMISGELTQDDFTKRERAIEFVCLGDVLAVQGKYSDARKAYEDGLGLMEELNDLPGQAATLG